MTEPVPEMQLITVLAGGSQGVGRHNTPASEMVEQTEAGGPGKQFRKNRAWFFPTINKWVDSQPPLMPPPPRPGAEGGAESLNGGIGKGGGSAGPAAAGGQLAAEGGISPGNDYRYSMSPQAAAMVSASGTAEHPADSISYVTGAGQAAALGSWGQIPGPDFDKPDEGFQNRFMTGNPEIGYDPVVGSNLIPEKEYEAMAQEKAENNPTPGGPGIYLGQVAGPDVYMRGYDPVVGSNLNPPSSRLSGLLNVTPAGRLLSAAGAGGNGQPSFGGGAADPSSGQPDFGGGESSDES